MSPHPLSTHNHALRHWRDYRAGVGPLPPFRLTHWQQTALLEDLHHILTRSCSWCMAGEIRALADRLEATQSGMRGRAVEALLLEWAAEQEPEVA